DRLSSKLASPYMDIPHAGCSALRFKPARASSCEPIIPHCKYAVALFCSISDDESPLAERLRRRPVCPSSSTCGVRCLGCRTKGCTVQLFLDAHHGHLLLLCRTSGSSEIPACSSALRFRLNGKTHVGNSSFCPAASGLLASPTLWARKIGPENPDKIEQTYAF